ncbi:nickel-binding protein [Pseudomonas paeninsulae]|uniref:nickel-binding protein n=1 Tax=Pseudomonas paeninsulae TaxID=3110772 RepID=UPI002D7787BB|nr:nickel-binding protein [Pseudomonas sp. IT1137]
MKRYVIERPMANAGQMGPRELSLVARHSHQAFKCLGGDIHWLHAYVADDKPFCIFPAKSSALIRRHGQIRGFAADSIHDVSRVFDLRCAAV